MEGGMIMDNASGSKTEFASQSGINKRILIIDDNWIDLKLMQKALKEIGYNEIHLADRGIVGIKKAISLKPHLIILDLHLPDINGILAYRIIKAGESHNTKVIIVSGAKNSSLLKVLDQMNCDGVIPDIFVEKSYDYLRLQKMVRSTL